MRLILELKSPYVDHNFSFCFFQVLVKRRGELLHLSPGEEELVANAALGTSVCFSFLPPVCFFVVLLPVFSWRLLTPENGSGVFLTKYKDTLESMSCVTMAQFKTKAYLYTLVQMIKKNKNIFGTMCFQVYSDVAENVFLGLLLVQLGQHLCHFLSYECFLSWPFKKNQDCNIFFRLL